MIIRNRDFKICKEQAISIGDKYWILKINSIDLDSNLINLKILEDVDSMTHHTKLYMIEDEVDDVDFLFGVEPLEYLGSIGKYSVFFNFDTDLKHSLSNT